MECLGKIEVNLLTKDIINVKIKRHEQLLDEHDAKLKYFIDEVKKIPSHLLIIGDNFKELHRENNLDRLGRVLIFQRNNIRKLKSYASFNELTYDEFKELHFYQSFSTLFVDEFKKFGEWLEQFKAKVYPKKEEVKIVIEEPFDKNKLMVDALKNEFSELYQNEKKLKEQIVALKSLSNLNIISEDDINNAVKLKEETYNQIKQRKIYIINKIEELYKS